MAKVIFITGGQRSGKSSFAQKKALELSDHPVYLATARVWDDDFAERVKRHQQDRDDRWRTVEEEMHISTIEFSKKEVVVLDCITLWLTNFFKDQDQNVDEVLGYAKKEWEAFQKKDITAIVVTNELGMGLHAHSESGRKFTDIQGFMNQYIAGQADEAYFMVSGIPQKIK